MLSYDESEHQKTDILWQMSWFLPKQRPNWLGFMHVAHKNQNHPGKSNILFFPMTDLNPGEMSCIYSTLTYLVNFACNNNQPTIVTFDPPLYWKASIIIYDSRDESELTKIILMLGSFHTFRNLFGTIGSLMSSSGVEDILKQIFAEDATVYILTGKAVSCAFRGHLMVDTFLDLLLFSLLKTKHIKLSFEEIDSAVDVLNPSILDEAM